MSPNCSRKSFFAKLGGFVAALGLLPKVLARPGEGPGEATTRPAAGTLRPEPRAVARRDSLL